MEEENIFAFYRRVIELSRIRAVRIYGNRAMHIFVCRTAA